VTIRAMLVAYDDSDKSWGYPIGPYEAATHELETPTCATCKWAEVAAALPRGFDGNTLVCNDPSDALAVDCAGPAEVYVKPEHGCVQWEGKE